MKFYESGVIVDIVGAGSGSGGLGGTASLIQIDVTNTVNSLGLYTDMFDLEQITQGYKVITSTLTLYNLSNVSSASFEIVDKDVNQVVQQGTIAPGDAISLVLNVASQKLLVRGSGYIQGRFIATAAL